MDPLELARQVIAESQLQNQVWSWIVTIVGLVGFILAGKKVWWSWYVNIFCQVLWVVYALVSHQPAFLVSAAVYTFVFGKNAYSWTKEHQAKKAELER